MESICPRALFCLARSFLFDKSWMFVLKAELKCCEETVELMLCPLVVIAGWLNEVGRGCAFLSRVEADDRLLP